MRREIKRFLIISITQLNDETSSIRQILQMNEVKTISNLQSYAVSDIASSAESLNQLFINLNRQINKFNI